MSDEKETPNDPDLSDPGEDTHNENLSPLPLRELEPEERDRGILTDVDRRFLTGFKDYNNRPQRSERRGIIRDRIVNAILDLSYLSSLDEGYRGRVLTRLDEDTDQGQLRTSMAALVEFLYIGLGGDVEWVEETIAHGVTSAQGELQDENKTFYTGESVDAAVEVNIDITRGYDVDEIEERFRAGRENTLTAAEVGVLVREGRVETDELVALDSTTRERINPETGEIEDPGPSPMFEAPDSAPTTRDPEGDEK